MPAELGRRQLPRAILRRCRGYSQPVRWDHIQIRPRLWVNTYPTVSGRQAFADEVEVIDREGDVSFGQAVNIRRLGLDATQHLGAAAGPRNAASGSLVTEPTKSIQALDTYAQVGVMTRVLRKSAT